MFDGTPPATRAESVFPGERLRVVSIAHTAVSRDVGRLRYRPFAESRDLDVHLVLPTRWHEFGRWTQADLADEGCGIPGPDPGAVLHPLPIRWPRAGAAKWYLHWYPSLGPLIRRVHPHVIHLWEEPWSVVALQAVLLNRHGAAIVLEVDQNILKRLPPPFEWIRRFVLKRTSMVLSRSEEATAVVRACGYRGPVQAISYGVDQTVFQPRAAGMAWVAGGALRLGYVGRLVEEKGLDDAIEAMARTDATVSLAIMGEGPHEAALRAHVARLGLTGRVTFCGWGKPADVAGFMRGLDALLLLTRTTPEVREQFGRVIVEAQSCGVPVIGSTCGAIPEVIGAGGWVVPERDPAALSRLMATLAAEPNRLEQRGNAGRVNVDARYTFDAVAASLLTGWMAAMGTQPAQARRRLPIPSQNWSMSRTEGRIQTEANQHQCH